jgi:hypothetical protein
MKVMAGEQPPLDQIDLPYCEYSDDDLAHRLLVRGGLARLPVQVRVLPEFTGQNRLGV